mmetsp:Transcript_6899/g.15867  ORF Transcript_6899/g.15867 Transcript_6899/m.15867 type:complete len:226 (+) Transcript_6899:387-1064(+)
MSPFRSLSFLCSLAFLLMLLLTRSKNIFTSISLAFGLHFAQGRVPGACKAGSNVSQRVFHRTFSSSTCELAAMTCLPLDRTRILDMTGSVLQIALKIPSKCSYGKALSSNRKKSFDAVVVQKMLLDDGLGAIHKSLVGTMSLQICQTLTTNGLIDLRASETSSACSKMCAASKRHRTTEKLSSYRVDVICNRGTTLFSKNAHSWSADSMEVFSAILVRCLSAMMT